MKFSIVNLGCKVNRVESDEAAALLLAAGWEMAGAEDAAVAGASDGAGARGAAGGEGADAGAWGADLVVVNTCTVTAEADKKTRKAVRRTIDANPQARIVVTGCSAALNRQVYEAMDARVQVVAKRDLLEELRRLAADECGEKVLVGGTFVGACRNGRSSASESIPDAARACSGEGASFSAAAIGDADASVGAAAPDGAAVPAGVAAPDGIPSPARTASPPASAPALLRVGGAFNTRVGVKVQDGCAHACTYCIVHVARGAPWSKPLRDVVREVRAHVEAGAREIVLAGINLGSYESDGARLADLLEALLDVLARVDGAGIGSGGGAGGVGIGSASVAGGVDGAGFATGRGASRMDAGGPGGANASCDPLQVPRIRLSSIEPMDVDERLVELLARADGRIARHLHLPLQSGSSKVLREMDRPYAASDFERLVRSIRSSVPAISLTTDIIAGFPGETDADFADTMALARAAGFSKIHVFPYSRREGTPAAARADQVPHEVKAHRAAALRRLSDELRTADLAARAGTVERALVERSCRATAESYHEVAVPPDARPGTFVAYRFPGDSASGADACGGAGVSGD